MHIIQQKTMTIYVPIMKFVTQSKVFIISKTESIDIKAQSKYPLKVKLV